jgi:peptide chain release factor 1
MCLLRRLPTTCINRIFYKNKNIYNQLHKIPYCTSSKYDLDLTIKGVSLRNYVMYLQQEYKNLSQENNLSAKTRILELQPVIDFLNERKSVVDNIQNLAELLNEKDDDIKKLAKEEKETFENTIKTIDRNLLEALLPTDDDDECNAIVLEINAGVGGQEAMLFANELFEMYSQFAEYQGVDILMFLL